MSSDTLRNNEKPYVFVMFAQFTISYFFIIFHTVNELFWREWITSSKSKIFFVNLTNPFKEFPESKAIYPSGSFDNFLGFRKRRNRLDVANVLSNQKQSSLTSGLEMPFCSTQQVREQGISEYHINEKRGGQKKELMSQVVLIGKPDNLEWLCKST